jgi:phenylpropionate dioxygenase-like ring-hydroxylating dioxygenase large terminal subunit
MALARRMFELIDRGETDLADEVMREPVTAYTSEDVLRFERQEIFSREPLLLGLSADIPEIGSWRSVDIGDSPLLMSRDRGGRVRLFLNSCRHRGVKLLEGSGQARAFTCRFHGWRYDLDGGLTNVPEPEGFEGLCRSDHGLVDLPVAEKYGMIFGSPVPGHPVDVDEVLCGLAPELMEWDFSSFHLYTAHHVHPFAGNWKFAWDTYCENYHFAFLHSETLSGYLYSRRQAVEFFGPHVRMVSALRSIDSLRDIPEAEWEPFKHISLQYRLYPSVSFSVYPEKVEAYWILPGRHPAEGHGIHAVYVSELPRTEEERVVLDEAIRFGCETVVNGEDLWVTGRSEPGLRAPASPGYVLFGRNEPVVQHFHCLYRQAIEASGYAGETVGAASAD